MKTAMIYLLARTHLQQPDLIVGHLNPQTMANYVYLCERFRLLERVAVLCSAMMMMLLVHIRIAIPTNRSAEGVFVNIDR